MDEDSYLLDLAFNVVLKPVSHGERDQALQLSWANGVRPYCQDSGVRSRIVVQKIQKIEKIGVKKIGVYLRILRGGEVR